MRVVMPITKDNHVFNILWERRGRPRRGRPRRPAAIRSQRITLFFQGNGIRFFLGVLLLAIVLSSSAVAGPGTDVATTSQEIQSESTSSKSGISQAPVKSATSAISSTSPIGQEKEKYSYTTDDETEAIQNAIERYNREFANEPITDISDSSLDRLIKYQFLDKKPESIADLVMRAGKIYRRVKEIVEERPKKEPKVDIPPGKGGECIDWAMETTLVNNAPKAPKTDGDPGDKQGLQTEEKELYIKVDGKYQQIKRVLPKIPAIIQKREKPGAFIAPRPDRLSNELSGSQKSADYKQ